MANLQDIEIAELRREIERLNELGRIAVSTGTQVIEERDVALAKIAAMESQEPVAEVTTACEPGYNGKCKTSIRLLNTNVVSAKLYLAPGATPKTLEAMAQEAALEQDPELAAPAAPAQRLSDAEIYELKCRHMPPTTDRDYVFYAASRAIETAFAGKNGITLEQKCLD